MGQVIGETDSRAERSKSGNLHFQNIMATLYHVLGIDPNSQLTDFSGRPVCLLDEPLGHLEAPLRLLLRRDLRLLSRRFPATIIQVTHDPAEALAVGDRMAVLHAGRLQQVGAPAELLQRAQNRFVAGFCRPAMCFCFRPTERAGCIV